MKKSVFTLSMSSALFFSACFSTNTEESSSGVIPETSNLFYSLPESIASGNPSESLLVVDEGTAARVADGSALDSTSIFDAYRPVPAYIHLAQEAKDQVKAFIEELRSYDIPDEYDDVKNGLHIESRTIDTTIIGSAQKFFVIHISNADTEEEILKMNYWKNARGQYRGNFFYTERDPASENIGASIHVHFNGHNEELYGKRMMVTFYQPEANLDDSNGSTVVKVWSRKKGNRVFATGVSYHPLFNDEFWGEGPKVYAFRSVVNTDKDRAVLRVAFADADSNLTDIFEKHPLDKMVINRFVQKYQEELDSNDSLAKAVAWSLENEKDLYAMYAEIVAGTFVEPVLDVSALTPEQFLKFIELNRTFLLDQAAQTGDKGIADLVNFIEMEQPVFLAKGSVFIGGKRHRERKGQGYGIESDELESNDLTDLNPGELSNFDPKVQEEPTEIEE